MDGERRPDIFDRLVALPLFRWAEPFYQAHREVLLYLFFGGLTFLVSMASFAAAVYWLGLNEHIANLISWVLAVSFAFVTNRLWVFEGGRDARGLELVRQIASFAGGRVATLLLEEAILFVFITLLHGNELLVKLIAQVVVIAANYVVSKLFVFK